MIDKAINWFFVVYLFCLSFWLFCSSLLSFVWFFDALV